MKRILKSRRRADASRRPGSYRPQLETLETRLPLGDALLSAVLGWGWVGSSFAVADQGLWTSEIADPHGFASGSRQSPRSSESAGQANGTVSAGNVLAAGATEKIVTNNRNSVPQGKYDDLGKPGTRQFWDWASAPWEEDPFALFTPIQSRVESHAKLVAGSAGDASGVRAPVVETVIVGGTLSQTPPLPNAPAGTKQPQSAAVAVPMSPGIDLAFAAQASSTAKPNQPPPGEKRLDPGPQDGELSFTEPIDFNLRAGDSPQSVTTGHLVTGDKNLDLAVANFGSNSVTILLGNGDGTFRFLQTDAVGSKPYFVTTGHFHDPNILDLAVANSGSNDVSILLGHGDGTFGAAHNFRAGTTPRSIAVGDFDGDGIQDLAVANRASNNVSILLGNGDGTFAPASNIAVGGAATFVVAADFAADGRQDLAVATVDSSPYQRGTVSILLGNGDGTFRAGQSLAVGRGLTSMVAHDFNGDGFADLAVTGQLTDTVSILLGRGDGTFMLNRNYQVGGQPQSIAVGDFDGDGIPDIVTASLYASASVLLGNGDGTFQTTHGFWGGANPIAVAVGDFNRDGRDDLAIVQNFSNQVSILLNDSPQPGDGVTVIRNIVYYDGPYSNPLRQTLDVYLPPEKTDFPVVFLAYGAAWRNGDQSRLAYLAQTLAREGLGVVAINHRATDGSSEQVVFPGHEVDVARAFAWTYHHITAYGGNPDNIFLLGHSSGAHLVSLLAADGRYLADQGLSPDLIKGVISVSGAYDVHFTFPLTDVFGDREQQWEASPLRYVNGAQPPFLVLYASNDTPEIAEDSPAFYQALVAAGSEAELHMIPARTHQMIMGNAAHPGDPARELMLRFIREHTGGSAPSAPRGWPAHSVSPSVAVSPSLMNIPPTDPGPQGGELSFEDPVDYTTGRSPQSVTTGHFHDPKILDLAVANSASNDVSIFLGNGHGTFRLVETVAVGRNPSFVTTGDFNGDGITDLVVANSGSNDVSILLGIGDGSFRLPRNYPVGTRPRSIAVADFDGDKVQDLAVANEGSNNVTILHGNGDGTFALTATIAVGGPATSVGVGDFDGDGHQDLAVVVVGRPIFNLTEPGKVSVLLGNGDGTFRSAQSYAVGGNPRALVVGDLKGDKVQDLAVANADSDNVSILLGNGDGTFAPAHNYPVGGNPRSLAVGDFDGDGTPDLVTANQYSSISVLLGKGDGTFEPTHDFWGGADPASVVAGDFSGHGLSDLAVANLNTGNVSVVLNNTPQPPDGVTIERDILYYDGPYNNPPRQSLDLYLPANQAAFPVVFLVFGGGHSVGDKSRLGYLARTLAREGLGVVAPSHRLTDGTAEQVIYPGYITDVARAFAWTYHHIADFGGDPEKIVLLGHSSGSALVAQLALDPRYLEIQGISRDVIKGAIVVSGNAYDLRERGNLSPIYGDREQRWQASAIRYVSANEPPVQIFYGGDEEEARRQSAEQLYHAIIDAGGKAEEVHEIPNRDHPGIIGRAARPGDPARELMLRFIAEHTR